LAHQFGARPFTEIAGVFTGGNGTWSYNARPLIQTAYEASANGGTTAPATIGVQPSILLSRISGQRFLTHVSAAGSFAGKQVKFQRQSGSSWATVKQSRPKPASPAVFPGAPLPKGTTSTTRTALSVSNARP